MADQSDFEWLNKQGVRSSRGFELQCVDRFAYEYREAGRVVRLDGESIVGGNPGFAFNPDWRRFFSKAEEGRISQNIRDAMSFMELATDLD